MKIYHRVAELWRYKDFRYLQSHYCLIELETKDKKDDLLKRLSTVWWQSLVENPDCLSTSPVSFPPMPTCQKECFNDGVTIVDDSHNMYPLLQAQVCTCVVGRDSFRIRKVLMVVAIKDTVL